MVKMTKINRFITILTLWEPLTINMRLCLKVKSNIYETRKRDRKSPAGIKSGVVGELKKIIKIKT